MKNKLYAGLLGYYGLSEDVECNKKRDEANKLVDEYNQKVATYETEDEQIKYQVEMVEKINKIIKSWKYGKY